MQDQKRRMDDLWRAYVDAAYREYERSRDRQPSVFPHYSAEGSWKLLDINAPSQWLAETYDHGNWTAGFWFGVMWLASLGSGSSKPASLAGDRLGQLRDRRLDHTTHDLGFLLYPSIVFGHACGFVDGGTVRWADEAAQVTARRFNTAGNYIQAFGPMGESQSAGTSTIDTMMNLPLMWWAHRQGAEPAILDTARRHARTSARLFLRPDNSTVHLLNLDPVSGALVEESTLQGAGAQSCWSRGQAWAVCGFAWAFAATGEREFLTAAERAATYFWHHVPSGQLPPWDFADTSPEAPRDASAAAVAALGALVLGYTHPDASAARQHDRQGRELLADTCDRALNHADSAGILLWSCYSYPHQQGLAGATAWGDFYLGLALGIATRHVPFNTALGSTDGS